MGLLCHFLDSGQGKVVQGGVVKVDDLRLRKWVVDNISPEEKIKSYLQPGARMFQNREALKNIENQLSLL